MRTIKLSRDQFRIWRGNDAETRDALRKEMLDKNGQETFRLMSPNARFLGTVRGEKSVISGAPMGVQSGAPSPEACACKAYAGTPKGQHHPVCQFKNPWENSKGIKIQEVANPSRSVTHTQVSRPIGPNPTVQHFSVPTEGGGTSGHIPTIQPAIKPRMISPTQCDCAKFTKPVDADPNQHHFVCQHFESWKIAHPTSTPEQAEKAAASAAESLVSDATPDTEPPPVYVLVDLDSKLIMREATSEEVEIAHAEESAGSGPFVTVDEVIYAVVPRSNNATAVKVTPTLASPAP